MYKIKRYGWRPGLKDQNDKQYVPPCHLLQALPPSVDLRSEMPPVYDQLNLGSCTAHGVAAILHFLEIKQNKPNPYVPARMAIYYNTRALEGTISYDAGASVADAVKSTAKWGFCNENLCPYIISRFDKAPSHAAYGAMWHERITQYATVTPDLLHLKTILASNNLFTFGFTVYSSFESNAVANTGIMPMPQKGEQVLGGHCVTCVGFNDANQWFVVRNSWGNSWGAQGYFYMPYQFITNPQYCDDFWTISNIP